MIHRSSIVLAFVCLCSAHAVAQITIQASDIYSFADTGRSRERDSSVVNSVYVGSPSSLPQTFDFSGAQFVHAATESMVAPAATSYGAHFPAATYAYEGIEEGFGGMIYMQSFGDSCVQLGAENATRRMTRMPSLPELKFPLTIGAEWTSTPAETVFVGNDTATADVREHVVCNGFGTLITTRGSFPCLRILRVMFKFSPNVGTQRYALYEFLTARGEEIFVEGVDTSDTLSTVINPESVTYVHPSGPATIRASSQPDAAFLQLFPNPVREQLAIDFVVAARGVVRCELLNVLGEHVATLASGMQSPGTHHTAIDCSQRTAGAYLCRLELNGRVTLRPITIVK